MKQTDTESLEKWALPKAKGTLRWWKKVILRGEKIHGIGTSAFSQPLSTNICTCNVYILDCMQEYVHRHGWRWHTLVFQRLLKDKDNSKMCVGKSIIWINWIKAHYCNMTKLPFVPAAVTLCIWWSLLYKMSLLTTISLTILEAQSQLVFIVYCRINLSYRVVWYGVYSIHLPFKHILCRSVHDRNFCVTNMWKNVFLMTDIWKITKEYPTAFHDKTRIMLKQASSPCKLRTARWNFKKTFAPSSFTKVWTVFYHKKIFLLQIYTCKGPLASQL